MNRKALIAAVAGIACVIGGCALLGSAAWRSWHGHAPRVFRLTPDAPIAELSVEVEPGRHARVALLLALAASDAPTSTDRVAVPATVRVRDSQGRVLLDETRDTDRHAARHQHARIARSGDGRLDLHYDFAKFMAPADGRIVLNATLAGERHDGAALAAAEVTLNDGIGDHAVGVTFGVFMLLAGWIAALVGVLNLVGNPAPPQPQSEVQPTERGLARRGHLLGLLAWPLPLLHLVVMAVSWLGNRHTSAFVEEHGREALNFQLSILVYLLIAFTLSMAFIGFLMLPLVLLLQVVMSIEAATQARAGHRFRYPLTFRFLRAP